MSSSLVIFNGIRFPYYLMEYSLERIKQHKASLHAVFLKAQKEVAEGYGFPNDMALTEEAMTADDAQKDDIAIINGHIKLAAGMAASEGITFTSQLITVCSLDDMVNIIKKYDNAYIDAAFDDENTSMINNREFALKDLMEHAPSSLTLVSDDNAPGK